MKIKSNSTTDYVKDPHSSSINHAVAEDRADRIILKWSSGKQTAI